MGQAVHIVGGEDDEDDGGGDSDGPGDEDPLPSWQVDPDKALHHKLT